MIKHDTIINSLIYGDMVQKLAQERRIGLTEARSLISEMSFKEYRSLEEASADITPPSGKPLSPATPPAQATPPGQQSQPATAGPAPVKPPSTQGTADPRGVQVRNPVTGKMEWMKPTAAAQPGQNAQPGALAAAALQAQAVSEDKDLARMKKLAGISEDGSCGASCAGAMGAGTPVSLGGTVRRRQPTNEQQPKEYEPKVAKTVVGDTKPGQASGELSANLAVRGKKTASRINNGFKR